MVTRFLLTCLISISVVYAADTRLNVAVTASFKPVIDALSADFTAQTGIELAVSSASTGILYQQILNGAPFDIFFAADAIRPQRLAQALSIPSSQVASYALGQLVLVSQTASVRELNDLAHYDKKIVIANPLHAPYGKAAEQVLSKAGFNGALVQANNVSQARQYLSLRLADVGLIAASVAAGFSYVLPLDPALYQPIDQQRLVLNPSAATAKLLAYLGSDKANSVLLSMGYLLPDVHDF